MKKCVKCGRTAENNNHSVCGYCGGNLVKDEGVHIGGEDRDDFTVVPQKKKSNNVLIVLVVIVLVGAIGLCCFLMGKLYNEEVITSPLKDEVQTGFDPEDEIKRIREKKAYAESGNLATKGESPKFYYNDSEEVVKIEVRPDSSFDYSRIYCYDNGELYFAFVFSGKEFENRFYFHSGDMFRWKEGTSGNQKDYNPGSEDFGKWEAKIKADAEYQWSMS